MAQAAELEAAPTVPVHPDTEIDFVIPVHNEAAVLEEHVRRLRAYLSAEVPYRSTVTIADNASTDGTLDIARRLARELADVRMVHLDDKGRGRALLAAWSTSTASILAYMDVDLSTGLTAILPLVAPLVSGHSDIAIGTRLSRGARVVRGPKREFISRGYNVLVRAALATRFSDAQCGFKAIRADRARKLLPLIADRGWFFDTELLVLAERAGMRIHEVPVDWVDDADSRVDILSTAFADLKGIVRLVGGLATGRLPLAVLRDGSGADDGLDAPGGLAGQLVRFSAVGLVSTAAYLVMFLLLGASLGPQRANATALLVTALANTAVNRRFTFGVRSRSGSTRHMTQGLVALAVGLVLTSGSLLALGQLAPRSGVGSEVAVLVAANLATTVVRFLLYRSWIFPWARLSTVAGDAAPMSRIDMSPIDRGKR